MRSNGWTSPLIIEDPATGVRRTLTTVRQAKDMLDRFWPGYHGSQYHRAERTCAAALHGDVAPVQARQALIAAAVEAHMRLS